MDLRRFEAVEGFQDPYGAPGNPAIYRSFGNRPSTPPYSPRGTTPPRFSPRSITPTPQLNFSPGFTGTVREAPVWKGEGYRDYDEYARHQALVNANINSFSPLASQYANRLPVPPTQSVLYEPEYSPRRLSRDLSRSHHSADQDFDAYSSRQVDGRHVGHLHRDMDMAASVDAHMPSIIRDNETGQLYELDRNYMGVPPRQGVLPSTLAKGYIIAICLVIVGVAMYFGISALVLGQDKQQKKQIIQANITGQARA